MGSESSDNNHSIAQTKNAKTSIEYPVENIALSFSVIDDSIFLINHHDNSRTYIGIVGIIFIIHYFIVIIGLIIIIIIITGSISLENEQQRKHRSSS